MLDAVETGREVANHELSLEDPVQVQPPGAAVVGRGGVVPDAVGDRGHTKNGVISSSEVFEVACQHAPLPVNPEEVVGVLVLALGNSFIHSLGHEGHGDDPTGAGRGRRTGAVAPEPGLDRERGRPQQGCGAEGHAVVYTVELDCGTNRALGHGRRRGPGRQPGPEPVEDAAELRRGLERPRRQPGPAGRGIRGAEEGGRAVHRDKRQKPGNSDVFGRFPTCALHFLEDSPRAYSRSRAIERARPESCQCVSRTEYDGYVTVLESNRGLTAVRPRSHGRQTLGAIPAITGC